MKEDADDYTLNLGNLNNGATLELFERLQSEVLENVRDPNTSAIKKRSITLKFTYAPSADRKSAQVAIESKVALASPDPTVGTIHITKIKGEVKAFVHDPAQDELRFSAPQGQAQ